MTDERKNLKIDAEDYGLLKACKPGGVTWGSFLTTSVIESTDHIPVEKERSGPVSRYVQCKECGRAENDLMQLAARPCDPDGIAVDE